jgi:O-antigen ligase
MRFGILGLLILVLLGLQVGIGGARLVYTVPGVSLLALAGLLAIFVPTRTDQKPSVWCLVAALLFSGYILVRNRLSEIDHLGRMQFYIMAGVLICYLLSALVLTSPKQRKALIYFLLIMALVQVGIGLYQFAKVNGWMPLPWAQRRDEWWRASGFFISPNHFSGYLEIAALMGLGLLLWGRQHIATRFLTGYAFFVCLVGIAISGSRGGYLSIMFGSFVFLGLSLYAWYYVRRERFVLLTSTVVVLTSIVVGGLFWIMFQSQTLKLRFQAINDPENMRFLLWDSAIQQWLLSPWFGTGAFSFFYFGRLFRNPSVQNDPIHVHNDYLQLLGDYGAIGGVLFLFLLIVHLMGGFRGLRVQLKRLQMAGETQSDSVALTIGGLSVIAAYLVHSVVDFNMHLTVNAILIGFVFGLLASPGTSVGSHRPVDAGPLPKILRFVLPVGCAALLWFTAAQIPSEYFSEKARVALRDENARASLEFALKGLAYDENNPDLLYYAAESSRILALQDPENENALRLQSISLFERALEVFPYDSRLGMKLALVWMQAGDYFEATNALAQAEEWDPFSSFVSAYRGILEMGDGNLDGALFSFEEARSLGGEGGRLATELIPTVRQLLAEEEEILRQQFPELFAERTLSAEQASEATALATALAEEIAEGEEDDPSVFDPAKMKSLQDILDWEREFGQGQDFPARPLRVEDAAIPSPSTE